MTTDRRLSRCLFLSVTVGRFVFVVCSSSGFSSSADCYAGDCVPPASAAPQPPEYSRIT